MEQFKNSMLVRILDDLKRGACRIEDIDVLVEDINNNFLPESPKSPKVEDTRDGRFQLLNEQNNHKQIEEEDPDFLIQSLLSEPPGVKEQAPSDLIYELMYGKKNARREEIDSEAFINEIFFQEFNEENNRKQKEEEDSEAFIRQLLDEEKRKLQDELDHKHYLCLICGDEYSIENIYVLDNCNHKYCIDCLEQMLMVKINDGSVQEINCPDPTCGNQIDYNQIKQIVRDERTFAKYEEFNLKKTLETIPDLRWCPRPGCGNAMIGSNDNPMMICSNDSCRFSFCFRCKEEWHADVTCEKYQEWKVENNEAEARYIDWVKTNTRDCPKCRANIQKNGGCNHMTCSNCRHEFCWLCKIDYNSSHWETSSCSQYS